MTWESPHSECVDAIVKLGRECVRLSDELRTFKRRHESGCIGQGVAGQASCTCGAWDHNERIERQIRGE